MRVAAVQMCGAATPEPNADVAVRLVRDAAAQGATYVQTPEVTNIVQRKRRLADPYVTTEDKDVVLTALQDVAASAGITIHVGSIAVRDGDTLRNRAFLLGPDGGIVARYDKVHMFDVDLPSGERFHESGTYTAGDRALLAEVDGATLGITICFDLRFPRLYEQLAASGADVLTAPSAFAASTGRDHWHVLVRARAIENGAFMIAAAQGGTHEDGRETYGHSLIVDPWGRILAEADRTPGIIVADLDLEASGRMRSQIPVLSARKPFEVVSAPTLERSTAS